MVMNRIALIVSTGVLALMLTACEDKSAPKTTPVNNDNVMEKTEHKMEHSNKVHEENMKKEETDANQPKATDTTGVTTPATETETPSH